MNLLEDNRGTFGTAHGAKVFHFFTAKLRVVVLGINKIPFRQTAIGDRRAADYPAQIGRNQPECKYISDQ